MVQHIPLCLQLLLISAILVTAKPPPSQNVRATWISVSQYNTSPKESQQTMQALAATGINRVYISVWKDGYAYFNSSTLRNLVGGDAFKDDQLSWAVKNARQNGLEVFAWFESGFSIGAPGVKNPFKDKAKNMGWVLGPSQGYTWLDAGLPNVVQLFSSMLADLANGYDVDGILLDSLCLPNSLAGANVSGMTNVATQLEKQYFRKFSAPLAVATSSMDDSLKSCNVDLAAWTYQDLFSEYVPQLFSNKYTNYTASLQATLTGTTKPSHKAMVVGLLCDDNTPTPWYELHQMLILTSRKYLGVSIWSAKCVLETYQKQLQGLWSPSV